MCPNYKQFINVSQYLLTDPILFSCFTMTFLTREATQEDKMKFIKLINQLTPDQLGTLLQFLEQRCNECLNEVVQSGVIGTM